MDSSEHESEGTEEPGEEADPERPQQSTFAGLRKLFQIAFTVALAVILALAVQSYAVKPYEIPSGSMEPTLDIGQRVLVDRFSSRIGEDPSIGDVVVFNPPMNAIRGGMSECGGQAQREFHQPCPKAGNQRGDEAFIKRVVAGPGDRVSIDNGIPIVNGKPVEGDWKTVPCRHQPGCDYPTPITVPDDSYFMMGDNRPGSDDSRFWGPVPRDWIIGHAVATYWPPNRIGGL